MPVLLGAGVAGSGGMTPEGGAAASEMGAASRPAAMRQAWEVLRGQLRVLWFDVSASSAASPQPNRIVWNCEVLSCI